MAPVLDLHFSAIVLLSVEQANVVAKSEDSDKDTISTLPKMSHAFTETMLPIVAHSVSSLATL